MSLRYAYNTNGCGSHRLPDALDLMAEAGYAGVALTLDHHHLDPFAEEWERQADALAARLHALKFGSVIETGARFLLDPRAKHEPTLVSASAEGRAFRVAFLKTGDRHRRHPGLGGGVLLGRRAEARRRAGAGPRLAA